MSDDVGTRSAENTLTEVERDALRRVVEPLMLPADLVAVVERIVAAHLREQEVRVRQEFANIGPWKVGQRALTSATGEDDGVIGSVLSQVRRQVIDGYAAALRTPPASTPCWFCTHVHTESSICRAVAIDGGPCVCTQDPTSPAASTPEEG